MSKRQTAVATKKRKMEDEDLPRGGGSAVTPLEVRKIHKQADSDFLFEIKSSKGKKGAKSPAKKDTRKKRKPAEDDEDDDKPKDGEGLASSVTAFNFPKFIEPLRFKSLAPGTSLLGAVTKVKDFKMHLTLPSGLTGVVPITEVTDTLSELLASKVDDEDDVLPKMSAFFKPGQLVPCVIKALEEREKGNKKNVVLSLRPSLLNQNLAIGNITPGMAIHGSVKSVEDHGYIISFGTNEFTGFLVKDTAEMTEDEESQTAQFVVGQPVACVVDSVKRENNTVTVHYDPDKFSTAVTKDNNVFTIQTLKAGMLINAQVKKVYKQGLFLQFLGYFGGTVSSQHLGCPLSKLSANYPEGKKVLGRIVHVDYENKMASFSLLPHIVKYQAYEFPEAVHIGQRFEAAKVTMVDKRNGLFLELPTEPAQAAFVPATLVSDESEENLKKYRMGREVVCRVVSRDPLEGVVTVAMKQSILDLAFLRREDIPIGKKLKGTILELVPKGMVISLTKSIRAFCPSSQMSDITQLQNPAAHFKIGDTIKCKALSVDPVAGRVIVTCKKSLVSSDLPVITSFEDAEPGVQSHGYISSVKEYGVFVTFFNGVTGLVGLSQLSNNFVDNPEKVYTAGQVVKCHVLTCDAQKKRISLSFLKKQKQEVLENEAYNWNELKVGSMVSGTVKYLVDGAVRVELSGGIAGVLPNPHLSDHVGHCEAIRATLSKGSVLKEMLVWSKNEAQKRITLSCKPSLIEAAKSGQLLQAREDFTSGTLSTGIIRGIETFGCFVEFANSIAGLAYVTNLVDGPLDDLKTRFTVGQTVRARVVDSTGDKLSLTLKPSQCGPNTSISFLQSYFKEEEAIASSKPEGAAPKPKVNWSAFEIGSSVEATIKILKDFGAVLTFADPNVTGFAVKDQIPEDNEELTEGAKVKAVVLDIDKQRYIIDVSLQPELISAALPASSQPAKKTAKRKSKGSNEAEGLKVGDEVESRVELIKGSYLVVSVPSTKPGVHVGYVATKDCNTQHTDPFSKFIIHEKCKAIVKEIPSTPNSRMLLLLSKIEKEEDKKKKNPAIDVTDLKAGNIVKAKITSVLPTQLNVSLGSHIRGRVHITEIADDISQLNGHANPLLKYTIGDHIEGKVLDVVLRAKHRLLPISHQNPVTSRSVDLSLRPADLALGEGQAAPRRTLETLSVGEKLLGVVDRVTPDGVWVSVTCILKGRVFILDMSDSAKDIRDLSEKYAVGTAVTCYVKHVDTQKKALDLTLVPNKGTEIKPGTVVLGRISKILPGVGVNMQLSPHTYGRVFITDIADDYTENPLADLKEGDVRECYVLGAKGNKVDLSLRPSRVNNLQVPKEQLAFPEIESVADLAVGKMVRGYVTETSTSAVFVALNRSLSARITRRELGQSPVKKIGVAFPVGKLVEAKVKSIGKRKKNEAKIELTLGTRGSKKLAFGDLKEGMKVKATIQSVKEKNLLVQIKRSKLIGMCRISELSDDFVDHPAKYYKEGDAVKALVIKIDPERQRFEVSLKPSHFEGDIDSSDEETAKPKKQRKSKKAKKQLDDSADSMLQDSDDEDEENLLVVSKSDSEAEEAEEDEEEEEDGDEMKVEGLAPVGFDWGDATPTKAEPIESKKRKRSAKAADDDEAKENEEEIELEEKKGKKKRAKKAQQAAEEEELAAKEEELLAEALPKTADDYEKLLLASPNSSFLWIKYMAFQLSIAEIDRAREIAERALKRINFREEQEKLNVWVALMNLENKHGSNESLMQVFQRALTYNDPKTVNLQLVGIYERSEQYKLAEELYKAMTKKFKHSWQIWLRYSQFHLKNLHSIEGARKVLERALQVLPKKKHIGVISKMAQMEFKHGSPERGRTIFEGILSNYPKRVDIWGIYIDMELALGDHGAIRNLFEKVTTLQLSSKKMRYFFERYLKFEKEHGTKESVGHVREKARQYVLSKSQE